VSQLVLPILYALLIWWASTGLVLYLDSLPRRTYRWSLAGATALLPVALIVLEFAARSATPVAAYVAFTSALIVWGWLELTFLTGVLTGPRREGCPEGCVGWRRFYYAVQALLWHELAIAAGGALILALTSQAPNQVGFATYAILWVMRISAKLNVYLGVPNLSEDLLPEPIAYLKSYLGRRPMNLLFPFSVTLGTVGVMLLAQAAMRPDADAFLATAHMLAAALLALAVLEHWFLVLPIRDAALWRWAVAARANHDLDEKLEEDDRERVPLAAGPAWAAAAPVPLTTRWRRR
jgi:putative photosynthetic complex assembly protein 2